MPANSSPRAPERIALLGQAFDVARRANDLVHQATALERLMQAQWESGAHRHAAVSFGALARLVGDGPATERCPASMAAELGRWDAAVTEGRARGLPTPA